MDSVVVELVELVVQLQFRHSSKENFSLGSSLAFSVVLELVAVVGDSVVVELAVQQSFLQHRSAVTGF